MFAGSMQRYLLDALGTEAMHALHDCESIGDYPHADRAHNIAAVWQKKYQSHAR
jgi:hypothetical protein